MRVRNANSYFVLSLLTVFCAFLLGSGQVRADELGSYLKSQYQGKRFLLRNFYRDGRLTYDSGGNVVDKASVGDWTADGVLQIRQIGMSHGRVKIEANRVLMLAQGSKGFSYLDTERKVRIDVRLDHDHPSPNDINVLLSKVFLAPQDHLADLVPNYWKSCVKTALDLKNKDNTGCHFQPDFSSLPGVTPDSAEAPDSSGQSDATPISLVQRGDDGKVHAVGKGVSPPRVLKQRDPEYSEAARKERIQGTVTLMLIVDATGTPTKIRIINPVGGGLDSQAVRAAEAWRFKPAEKDGQPVAVEIALEVDFHLY
jgi:TonB family protein